LERSGERQDFKSRNVEMVAPAADTTKRSAAVYGLRETDDGSDAVPTWPSWIRMPNMQRRRTIRRSSSGMGALDAPFTHRPYPRVEAGPDTYGAMAVPLSPETPI